MGATISTINLFSIEHQIPQSKISELFENQERLPIKKRENFYLKVKMTVPDGERRYKRQI